MSNNSDNPSWIDEFAQKQVANVELQRAKALKSLQEKREQQRKSAKKLLLSCQTKTEKYVKRKVGCLYIILVLMTDACYV